MIQVRNVPDKLHKEMVKRAKARNLTLSDFIQSLLEREAERPSPEEVFARIRSRTPVDLGGRSVADLIREEREERESRLGD